MVVFVPGLMGSALRYKGLGPAGNSVDEEIWSEDVSVLMAERNLDRLIYPTPDPAVVYADHILERVTFLTRAFASPLYGPLLEYLRRNTAVRDAPLLEFAYDWRASIRHSAVHLVDKIQRMLAHNRATSFVLVTHSMGGLIARLALLECVDHRRRLRRVVHIASPLRGSIKAFWTLKIAPALNPPLDGAVRTLLAVRDIARALRGSVGLNDKFMQAIRSFPSIYELLPPGDIQPLLSGTGGHRSCVDLDVWHGDYRAHVKEAEHTHQRLAEAARMALPGFVIFSAAFDTDVEYQLRSNQPYSLDVERLPSSAFGDSTVTVDSATWSAPPAARYLETQRPNSHMSLCRNRRVLAQLDREIFS